MLAIARAMVMNPDLLLMDEPSQALAPQLIQEVEKIIQEIKGTGVSVLLVEQNLSLALSMSERCYIFNKGRVVYHSTPAELLKNEEIIHKYLGV